MAGIKPLQTMLQNSYQIVGGRKRRTRNTCLARGALIDMLQRLKEFGAWFLISVIFLVAAIIAYHVFTAIWILVAIAVVIGGFWILLRNSKDPDD